MAIPAYVCLQKFKEEKLMGGQCCEDPGAAERRRRMNVSPPLFTQGHLNRESRSC